jgi:hypothetical protein
MDVSRELHAPAALPPGKNRYPLDRSLVGPQNQSGSGARRKIHNPYKESNPGRTARSLVSVTTVPPLLLNHVQCKNYLMRKLYVRLTEVGLGFCFGKCNSD